MKYIEITSDRGVRIRGTKHGKGSIVQVSHADRARLLNARQAKDTDKATPKSVPWKPAAAKPVAAATETTTSEG